MPGFIVTGPDGKEWDVDTPDNATEQDAIAYVQSQYYSQQSPGVSRGESFMRGAQDPAVGTRQLMANAGYTPSFEDSMIGGDVERFGNMRSGAEVDQRASRINQEVATDEADYQGRRGEAGVDWMRVLGNIAINAPTAAVPNPASLGGIAAAGALTGGTMASMMPVTEGDYFAGKVQQVSTGTLTGGLGAAALGAVARPFSQPVAGNSAAQSLADRGVRLTPGQMIGPRAARFEEKLAGVVPFVGDARRRAVEDFNKAAYDEVLAPLGKRFSGKVGRDGIASVQKIIGQAFDDALSKARFIPDEQFSTELTNLRAMEVEGMDESALKLFNRELDKAFRSTQQGNGSMSGRTLQAVEQRLRELASKFSKDQNIMTQETLGNGFREAHRIFDDAITRLNPKEAAKYANAKTSYALYKRLEDAATRAGSVEGVFTPEALHSAVNQAGKSYGSKAALARGEGMLQNFATTGREVLGNTVPNSGTPERLAAQVAATGGLGFVDPTLAAGVGAGSLLYTQPGQRLAQSFLMGNRPTWVQGFGGLFGRAAVPIGAGAGLVAAGQ